MKEDRFSKKALLFFSEKATIWQETAKEAGKPTSEVMEDFIGPNLTGKLKNWLDPDTRQNFGALVKRIKRETKRYKKDYKLDFPEADVIRAVGAFKDYTVDVYTFASLLKMSISKAEEILDAYYYDKNPFPELLRYEKLTDALQKANRRGGTYRVFLERGDKTIQGRMRIRYALNRMVRVKLNLYRYRFIEDDLKPYHEYDGFMKEADRIFVAIFEERDSASSPDFFHFTLNITSDQATKSAPWFGHYLSSTKGIDRQSVSGRICVYRTGDNKQDDVDLIAFMHNPDKNEEMKFDKFLKDNDIGKP